MSYILISALITLHIVAFAAYLLGGSLDKALLSATPVIGAVMFLSDLIRKRI